MRQTLTLLRYYFTLVILFVVAKPLFILSQSHEVTGTLSVSDYFDVMTHGLPLDLATAGYASAPIWLLLALTLWVRVPKMRLIYNVYAALVASLLAVICVADACIYSFWGIKLDGTVWGYISQPEGALRSVSGGYALLVALVIVVVGVAVFSLLRRALPADLGRCRRPIGWSALWVVMGGLLFLGIRGGVGRSTANVGMVYYSDRPFLNHAAVNPVFSIVSSLFKTRDFAAEYNFYPEARRRALFSTLEYNTQSVSPDSLLTTSRPNVLLILMEGCGGTFVHAVDSLSDPNVTPNLNRLAREGVVFIQCYANSFRTDRGTVSTLSGYPAYPDLSVMKVPALVQHLPSIARTLRGAGYSTSFLYGGDINFTGTHGYLVATGYGDTRGDTSFPVSVRRTHAWGVTDGIVLDTLYQMVTRQPAGRPWHIGCLTLASHEPWQVPYSRIKGDERANAMAYLDDCIGRFIDRLRRTPAWANTLVILLPDHGIGYPEGLSDSDPRRSHIPLIWTGGAVRKARTIPTLCNQSDLAATLLGQLGLSHADFRFSRDVMSRSYTRPSAAHTWSGGFLWLEPAGRTVFDLVRQPVAVSASAPAPSAPREQRAKAYLQTIYDALGK